MAQDIDSALRARIDEFVADLSDLIRQAALDSVREAIDAEAGGRRPGRPRATTRRTKKAATRKTPRGRKTGKRIRRSAEDLDKLADRILTYVRANPGKGVEAISKALRRPTKELKRPVQMLLQSKQLRTEGQKRGTTYFAGAGGKRATSGTRRKTAKRKTAKRGRKKASKK